MEKLNNKILNLSEYLQILSKTEYSEKVQQAAEKKDKTTLVNICKSAKIPAAYIGSVVSIVLSLSPQKWPADV